MTRDLIALIMGTGSVYAIFYCWGSGFLGGFQFYNKIPKWTKKLLAIATLLSIMGCGAAIEIAASAASRVVAESSVNDSSHWRPLGSIAPPSFEVLKRLRLEDGKKKNNKRDLREAAKEAMEQPIQPVLKSVSENGVTYSLIGWSKSEPRGTRQGPYCRVTCAAHHGGKYDVETLPEACKANWIPPESYQVPGWIAEDDKEESLNPWPGPATAGFESYKLYWSAVQSEAKIISAAKP